MRHARRRTSWQAVKSAWRRTFTLRSRVGKARTVTSNTNADVEMYRNMIDKEIFRAILLGPFVNDGN